VANDVTYADYDSQKLTSIQYPAAFKVYNEYCKANSSLLGTTLLIPPQPSDASQHWIACLFTSNDYGKRKGTPESILAATKTAIEDLKAQLERKNSEGEKVDGVWACKFNSARFGVPWERSREVVEEVGLGMTVVDRE
jgi:ADP-ribose 1''-phosphate phosphatase